MWQRLIIPVIGALQLLPSVEVQQRDSTASVSGGRGGHRMELQGLLPPWVLDRLFTVLQDSQHGQFQVWTEIVITVIRGIVRTLSVING